MRKAFLAGAVLLSSFNIVLAEEGSNRSLDDVIEEARARGASVSAITPVFSQLVRFSIPAGFGIAFENVNGPSYIQEFVPKGETVQNWNQMITLTGAKDVAQFPNMSASGFANYFVGLAQKSCPPAFGGVNLGPMRINGNEAHAIVINCGKSPMPGVNKSETTWILVVKGAKDMYTFQWAERAEPLSKPFELDEKKTKERIAKLATLKLCDIVPGEKPPYPSCASR